MKKAFTLVELIVVIAIIALLMALALPIFGLARERAAEVVCQSQLRQMAMILKTYCSDHDSLFPNPATLYHSRQSCLDVNYPWECRWHDAEIGPTSTLFYECKAFQGSLIPYLGNPRILLCKTGARANRERACCEGHPVRPDGRVVAPVIPQYTYTMNGFLNIHPFPTGGWPTGSTASPRIAQSARMTDGIRRESQVTRNPSEVVAFGEENSWSINRTGQQAPGKAWPAPYYLSSPGYFVRIGTGEDGPPVSDRTGPISLSALDIYPSYGLEGTGAAGQVKVVRSDGVGGEDAFATCHHPRGGDLNTGYSFASMLDGHVRKVTVSDQLRKSRQVESLPPSRLGPGGNLHLVWPLDAPPPGGWENQ
jgi:prepilin-type N-terminal cleavage/methylation domain-containing protein